MPFNNNPVSATWVRVTSLSAPKVITAASLSMNKSSPMTASAATDRPPSVCSEPSVVLVAAVVSSVLIIPLAVIAAVVVAPAISTAPE